MAREKNDPQDLNKMRVDALMSVAKEYMRAGRFEEALKVLNDAVALDPTALRPRLGLGITLTRLGRFDDAKAVAAEMFRLQDNSPGAFNVLGACHEARGDLVAAKEAFEEAVFFGARVAIIQHNCACFWARQGNAENCRRYLENAIALDAGINVLAATDVDLAKYRGQPWFDELVAFKK